MSDSDLPENLRVLIDEFNRSGLRELHVRKGDFELLLSHVDHAPSELRSAPREQSGRAQAVPAPSAQPVSSPSPDLDEPIAKELPAGTVAINAPNLGTFYRSPKPGAVPYIQVGDIIETGAELCLIEVMKLFTTLRSDVAGTVEAVLVEDGAMVEAGKPLFAVKAD